MRHHLAALLAAAALPALAGEVRGAVRYAGPAPRPAPLEVTKDRATCGESAPDESLVVAEGRLAHAVVQLRGVPGPPPAPVTATLDQVRCRFVPRVQAVPRGSALDIVSSDPVLHNVHGWIGRATAFNQALPLQGQKASRTLDRPGIIRVSCDVHDWMAAWVLVTEGPAAVTGADGTFAFSGVPEGTYTALSWHERLGELTAQVTVPARGAATVELVYGR